MGQLPAHALVHFVIPAYNEEANVGLVVRRLRALYPDGCVVVVNDGSTDGTAARARDGGAQVVIDMPFNAGYGTALHTGLVWSARHEAKYTVTLDADGQHDPTQIEKLLNLMEAGADIALGSRFLPESVCYRVPAARRAASWLFARTVSLLAGKRFTDPTTGFQCLNRKALLLLVNLRDFPEKYPDADLILYSHLRGCRVEEAAVAMHADQTGDSMHGLWKSALYAPKMFVAMLAVFLNRFAH
jgi:glycosyltransferase involved in cell wall biosynthesis